MIRNHPILTGTFAGVIAGAAVIVALYKSAGGTLLYRVLMSLNWLPDRLSDWITMDIFGGPREAGFLAFVPLCIIYWVFIGGAFGYAASLVLRHQDENT
jgi:hypothetical protein